MGATLEYHPHGDSSIHEVIGSMGKTWENNIPLIDGQGNYGSPAGDEVGAPRYIEAKLSEFALKAYFDDFDNSTVDFKPNYDNTTFEPEFLPSKYPIILLNGNFASIGLNASPIIK